MTPLASIIPRVTGSISAIGSSLIITLIFRSDKKLSTIYHRIMFFMSCGDILSSVAMAMTTLPMPATRVCGSEGWNFIDSIRLGNIQTCEAQGFFIVFGTFTMYAYNGILCVYYACAIAFQMKENTIKKKVEPFLHLLCLTIALGNSLPPLFLQLYNSSRFDAWCTIFALKCRGTRNSDVAILISLSCQLIILFVVMITCFALMIRRACMIDKEINLYAHSKTHTPVKSHIIRTKHQLDQIDAKKGTLKANMSCYELKQVVSKHEATKVIVIQAIAYFMALILSLLFPIIRIVGVEGEWPLYLQLIFMPLQGFFNFIIFIGHKVYNYSRVNEEDSYCTILRKFFCDSDIQEPILLSRISLVGRDSEIVEVHINDETGSERGKIVHLDSNEEDVMVDNGSMRDLSGLHDVREIDSVNLGVRRSLSVAQSSIYHGSQSQMEINSSFFSEDDEMIDNEMSISRDTSNGKKKDAFVLDY